MTDTCIIYYHGNDWDGTPARQRYLMAAMAKYVPVIYLDQGRGPRGRVVRHQPQANVTVVRGLVKMIYALKLRGLGVLVPAYVRWQMRDWGRQYRKIILWTAESWLRPHRFMPHDLFVYDCIDPCFSDDPEELTKHSAREREVVEAADVVFASADTLVEDCLQWRSDVTLLNNACEPSEYAPELIATARKPSWWPADEAPVAAYLGSLDWRFDFEYAETACRMNPDVRFVFAGAVSPDFEGSVSVLRKMPNVVCPGRISVEDGRYLLANSQLGLILFKQNRFNDAVNPVKLYAHACVGKSILGTSVRELNSRAPIVRVESTPQAFGVAVGEELNARDERLSPRQKAFAGVNTWENRAAIAWERISAVMVEREPA